MEKIRILIVLMCLLLVPIATPYTNIEAITFEEPTQSWFQRLSTLQFTALGGSFSKSYVTKGDYVDAQVKLKFYHDCEKYKLDFWFMSPGQIGGITMSRIVDIPHKTGDTATANMKNIPTSGIPDSYCDKEIKGYVRHYSYWGGYEYGDNLCHKSEPVVSLDCANNPRLSYDKSPTWHQEEGSYLDTSFILKCGSQCEETAIGSLVCSSGLQNIEDGNVVQRWQYKDCDTGWIMMDDCHDNGCSGGECLEVCETGAIGSEFCKENSVYQRYGLGRVVMMCKVEDRLIQTCSGDQVCDAGQCITQQSCGDGSCNAGETYNTCPSDCPKSWSCGDGTCNSDETEENCPVDCQIGCSDGDTQTKECEDGNIITTHTCQDNEWVETGKECSGEDKIPSWIIPTVIGVLFIGGLVIIFKTGKKGKKSKKK